MTSRERVLAALAHQETDRVPVDLSGHRSSGIAAMAYARLRRHLGLEPRPIRVYDPIQQIAIVDEDVLQRFGVDTIELGRAFAVEDEAWADWVLPDGTPCQMLARDLPERRDGEWVVRSRSGRVLARMPDGAIYFEQAYWPFADPDWPDPDDIEGAFAECMWTAIGSPSGPLTAAPGGRDLKAEVAAAFRARSDRAILGLFGGNLLEVGQFLFRNDGFFMLLASEPERAHAFLDRLVEIHMGNLEAFLRSVGPSIDIIVFGDDLGMQDGPQISPAMYREFFKPRHAALWGRAKELAPVKVMLHSCGSLRALLPDLIDAGLDAVNPVQVNTAGMDLAGLKRDFGARLTLWGGGCDTRTVLPHATPAEVAAHVRRQVTVGRAGGGFVFQQVHNILADVPSENVVAMLDAVNGAPASA